MPPAKPPFPTAKNLPFHSSGRKMPNPKVVLPTDFTWMEAAHKAGRLGGLVGYPVSLCGVSNVPFATTRRAKLTLAPSGKAA